MSGALNIHQRMAAVISDLGALEKTGKTKYGEPYNYHTVDHVADALRPVLAKHGVGMVTTARDCVTQLVHSPIKNNPNNHDWSVSGMVDVKFVSLDNPSDAVTHSAPGHGVDVGDKAAGKMISYGWKGAVITALMLKGQPDNEDKQSRPSSPPPPADDHAQQLTREQLQPLVDYYTTNNLDPRTVAEFAVETYGRGPRDLTPAELQDLIRRHSKA